MASVRASASQAAWFPQTRAGFSREFCVIWAGRRGAEEEGLGALSGALLKAKQDVWSQILVMLQPPDPPAPRPPSARHVTAREQQENAEELWWKSQWRQAASRP